MRVFILCTGRSASSTFIKACEHITNYTAGHETRVSRFEKERFNYPDNHIEADNRLSWQLGWIDKMYGDEAMYVHLKRNRDQVARSFMKRFFIPRSMIDAFCEGIRMVPPEELTESQKLQACYDYVDTVNLNIESFLATKTRVMTLTLQEVERGFPVFWKTIGARGNLEHALKEFSVSHNSSGNREWNYGLRLKLLVLREWNHIKRCLKY